MPSEHVDSSFDETLALLERERNDPFVGNASRKAALARRLEHAAIAIAATAAVPLAGVALQAAGRALHPAVPEAAKRLVGWGLATKVGVASLLVMSGGITGAVVQARFAGPREPQSVSSTAFASAPAGPSVLPVLSERPAAIPSVDVASLPSAPPSIASTVQPRAAPSVRSAGSPEASSATLEHDLLSTAQTAIERGAYSAALTTLTDHVARFPKSNHAEERELLFVQALSGAGKNVEAVARARAFEAQYPTSIFLPAVKAALSTNDP